MSGLQIGPFTLLHPLGGGGMAEVWKARYQARQLDVALKLLVHLEQLGEDAQSNVKNEVRVIAGLNHPNIITLYDLGELEHKLTLTINPGEKLVVPARTPYLVMELVSGGTLETLSEHLDWPQLKTVLLVLLDALAHAHARGILHLDMKPENVLLDDTRDLSRLKLSDFGIAQALDRRDLTDATGKRRELDKRLKHLVGQVMGTPIYMAPEQFMGEWRNQGPWTDLYSLGCMTFKLVTGAPPFESENLMGIGAAHCQEPPPPMRPRFPVPAGLTDWVMRLLEKQPEARYQRAADAAWALEQLPDPDVSAFVAPSAAPQARRSAMTVVAEETGKHAPPLLPPQTPAFRSGPRPQKGSQEHVSHRDAGQEATSYSSGPNPLPGPAPRAYPTPTPPPAASPAAASTPAEPVNILDTPTMRMAPLLPPQPSHYTPAPSTTPASFAARSLAPLPDDALAMLPSLPGRHGPSVLSLLHGGESPFAGAISALMPPPEIPAEPDDSPEDNSLSGPTVLDTEIPEFASTEATTYQTRPGGRAPSQQVAPMRPEPAEVLLGPPPLPLSWMSASDQRVMAAVQGLGLSLYGLRAIPLVDREEERDAIWSLLHQVHTRGRARVMVLQGTTGIGKSRLAEWVSERAHEVGGASVLIAEHSPGQLATDGLSGMLARFMRCMGMTLEGAQDRVRHVLTSRGVADPRLEQALLLWMAPLLSGQAEAEGLPSMPLAERHAALRQFLELLSRERPLIIVLDDVQWGAEAIRFCQGIMLGQSRRPFRILLLLTAQEEVLTERLLEASELEELLKQEGARRLKLGPLPQTHHAQLVRELLGLEPSVAQQVEERTAGNPLFAIQLVGDWVSRELLIPGGRGFCLRPGMVLPLPDDIHQMWDQRIRQLLHGMHLLAHPALELAAILGQTINLQEWRASIEVAGLKFSENLQNKLLDSLLSARLIRPPQSESTGGLNTFTFSHGMLRESLLRASRENGRDKALHLACARMLEKRYKPGTLGIAERLGRHFLEANALELALPPLLVAAEKQRDQSHYDRSLDLLDRREAALDALKIPASDPRRAEGELLRAQLGIDLRRPDRSVRALNRLQQGMQQPGWKPLFPSILRVHGDYFRYVGDFKTARSWYDQALPMAEYMGLRLEQALALRGLANVAWESNDVHTTVKLYQEALTLFQLEGDLVRLAAAHTFLGHVAQQVGENDTARGWFLSARRLGEQYGLQSVLADALRGLGRIRLYHERNPGGAMELFQQSADILERLGGHYSLVDCKNEQGEAARAAGQLERAARYFQESIELAVRTGSTSKTCATLNLATVRLLQQRAQEALQLLEGVVEELIKVGRPRFVGGIFATQAWAAAMLGRWGQAAQWVGEAAVWLGKSSAVDEEDIKALEKAGQLADAVGQLEVARQAYQEVIRLWEILNKPEHAARVKAQLRA